MSSEYNNEINNEENEKAVSKDKSFTKGLITGFISALAFAGLVLAVFFVLKNTEDRNAGLFYQAGSGSSGAGEKTARTFPGAKSSGETDAEVKKGADTKDVVESEEFRKKYRAINNIINNYYLDADDVTEDEITDGMLHGYLNSIGDKYAEYFNSKEYSELLENNSGQYGGIGVYLSEEKDTGRFIIANTFKGEPGDLAGLKAGDVVTHVDDISVADIKLDELSEIVKGEPGTTVKITVYRDGKKIDFTIERKIIELTTVAYKMIENGTIGYIYISSFDMQTQGQFKEALDALERQHAKGIIIDVRNNGGGVLTAAIEILDRLLPEGLVLYTENKKGRSGEYYSNAEEYYDKPYCVLINEYSASASEVFAGAIQDFGTAKLIGMKSYGKGVIQSIIPLNGIDDGSGVKVTTERYFTPKGRNIDGVGIEPDIKVEIDEGKEIKKGEYIYDTQMQEAVKHIQGMIKN